MNRYVIEIAFTADPVFLAEGDDMTPSIQDAYVWNRRDRAELVAAGVRHFCPDATVCIREVAPTLTTPANIESLADRIVRMDFAATVTKSTGSKVAEYCRAISNLGNVCNPMGLRVDEVLEAARRRMET